MNPPLPTPNLPELTTPPSGGWGAPSGAGFPSPGRVSAGAPALPVIDFVGPPAPSRPSSPVPLADDTLRRHFGELGAIRINFVPAMLNELVIHTASRLADRLVEVRDSRLKRHTRLIRDAVAKQRSCIDRRRGPNAGEETARYGRRYIQSVATQCWLFQLGLQEQCRNRYPDIDEQTAALVNLTAIIATYARSYELEMNRQISARIGAPVHKEPDLCPTIVHAICVDIAETYGYQLNVTHDAHLWAKILSQKAFDLAETIYNEEKSSPHGS